MSSIKLPVRREYEPAPVCLGGGFVFPELNDGIPWRSMEEWEQILIESNTECDWPECTARAAAPVVVDQFTPLLCRGHIAWTEESVGKTRVFARKLIKDHLRDLVLIASYGSPKTRGLVEPAQLSEPYIPYDQRTPRTTRDGQQQQVVRLSLPKLGQNMT